MCEFPEVAVTVTAVTVVTVGAVYVTLTNLLSPVGVMVGALTLPPPVIVKDAPLFEESLTTVAVIVRDCPESSVWGAMGEIAIRLIPPPPQPAIGNKRPNNSQDRGISRNWTLRMRISIQRCSPGLVPSHRLRLD